ncbi:restriction endonuclease subunit S [Butyricimonas virosa]|uniref:restriction endonuclease subunit S n=1 Tax=Butyricimonas virosa TaxID=544645 RepID=UPI0032C1A21C
METELQDIVPNICSGKDRISNSGEVALYGSTGVIGRTNSASYKENIVLVARVGANAGQMQIGNAPCGVTDNTLVIDAKEWNYYIYYFLQHYNLNRLVFGSGQPLITGGMLKRIKVRYGCKAERNNITRLLCLIDERIATQNKIIEKLQSLIRGIVTKICSGAFVKGKYVFLRDILIERHIKNIENYEVYSVSVSQGIINQIDYLGRSFASKETLHYNVVNYGDIVYTKSPTGDFPYGIVKRSHIQKPIAVSPLYGVYQPKNDYIGKYLHLYFKSPINTKNYLHRLIQKGAKNTINITNSHFLDNNVFIPEKPELINIVNLTSAIEDKLVLASRMLDSLKSQKGYLLSKMFI